MGKGRGGVSVCSEWVKPALILVLGRPIACRETETETVMHDSERSPSSCMPESPTIFELTHADLQQTEADQVQKLQWTTKSWDLECRIRRDSSSFSII